jgi:type 1 glutamine amidotransferase
MIAAARPFFRKMAADNNFTLDFTDDTSKINIANLSHYDVFVMLHLAPFDMSASQQAALQQFVEAGGGWVGIHAAGLTGREFLGPNPKNAYWSWFEDFMGGIVYSPHPAFQQARVIVEDQHHPATIHLPANVQWPDEWYEFNKSPRDRVRVLARVDESSYKQNKPMGDHPIIWTNERYRRMIYIGVGHSPDLLSDSNYTTMVRDALCWAGGKDPEIPMKNSVISYEKVYFIPGQTAYTSLRKVLSRTPGLTLQYADPQSGTLSGTGLIKLITSANPAVTSATSAPSPRTARTLRSTISRTSSAPRAAATPLPAPPPPPAGTSSAPSITLPSSTSSPRAAIPSSVPTHYFWLKFAWSIKTTGDRYTLIIKNYYEKPNLTGISNDYSKIEYRWWDFRHAHPWSDEDRRLFEGLDSSTLTLMDQLYTDASSAPHLASATTTHSASAATHPASATSPRFHALVLYENGGWHIEYSKRARTWLTQLSADSNFTIDYLTHTDSITDDLLSRYQLIIQLDYVPYAWTPAAMAAFQKYIEEGRGGWLGFHHATLLGEFDGYPMWTWFHDFMGGIRWKDYIARFAQGTIRVEDRRHPIMQGIPDSFIVRKEEWYTYDKSPRPNVHVIASVDESTYRPDTSVRMGDHPVIWSNPHVRARNIYIFMGHAPILFDDPSYCKLFSNAIFWTAAAPATPAFRVLAFYSNSVEPDHVAFARDAIDFYTSLAARKGFAFDTTSDWEQTKTGLQRYKVVLWLNDFPKTSAQRLAFQSYMEEGGAWLGFHVAGYNDRYTNWPWFIHFFGGAVFYNNNWPPLPAKLVVSSSRFPVTRRLPLHYTAPINEWYGWSPNPRLDKDIRVLITLDKANYPLGKKDIIGSGDIPVVWTNTRYKMLYMNMGHGDQIFSSPTQNLLFEDGLLWLASPR